MPLNRRVLPGNSPAGIPEGNSIEFLEKAGNYAKGNYQNEAAIDFYNREIKIINVQVKTTGCGDHQLIDTLLIKGNILKLIGKWDVALADYKDSLEFAEKLKDKQRIAQVERNIGIQYRLKGNYAKAMECYKKNMRISEELGWRFG